MRLPPLARLGPYEIVELLGAGGMGEVYLARDTRLDRQVAIKRLLTGASGEHGERFWREARAAAAVSHPNICQIFDVGEHAGEPYLAMELLAGESLAARIARGPLGAPASSAVLGQVLAALAALHERGLVHRDLKPANVFLTPHGDPWGVKVLDFGLALPTAGALAGDPRLTRTGMLVGTPAYMAPEQWLGETVGPPTDIFACGAILFEVLTGRPAFAGDGPIAIYEAVTRGRRPRLGRVELGAFEAVVERALARLPDQRFPSASAMAADLATAASLAGREGGSAAGQRAAPGGAATADPAARTLVTSARTSRGWATTPSRPISRLLVVPFRQLRPDPETEFLGLALAEAVSASLGGLSRLVVRSPRVAAHAGDLDNLPALAAAADVDVVLVGSLQRAGDRIRCATQLLAVPNGTVLAAHTAQATMADLFDLQDDLTRQVVEALRVPLSGRDEQRLAADVPADPRAYELYLKATSVTVNTASSTSMTALRELLEQCLALDPGYAPAWARLARVYRLLAKYGHTADPEEHVRRAREAFDRALALNPDLPLAHNYYTYFELEELASPGAALRRLLGQLEGRPADPEIYAGLVTVCRFCGLFAASVAAHEKARQLDPHVRTSVHYTYLLLGDYERAEALDDEPVGFVHHYCLPLLASPEETRRGLDAWCRRLESGHERHIAKSMLAAVMGEREICETELAKLGSGFRDAEGMYMMARSLAKVGAHERALDVLSRVVRDGFSCPIALARDPWLESVRCEPRFQDLMAAAESASRRARELYLEAGGPRLLGMAEPV